MAPQLPIDLMILAWLKLLPFARCRCRRKECKASVLHLFKILSGVIDLILRVRLNAVLRAAPAPGRCLNTVQMTTQLGNCDANVSSMERIESYKERMVRPCKTRSWERAV